MLACAAAAGGTAAPRDWFRTPDGAIRCIWAPAPTGFLRCDRRTVYPAVPAPPATCRGLAWGDAFRLFPTGRAALCCHGDAAFGSDTPPVPA